MYRLPDLRSFVPLLVLLAGAVGAVPAAAAASGSADGPGGSLVLVEDEYHIHIGDMLDVKFFYSPDFNEQVVVRPDGRISLPLIGEVRAAGMTPIELTDLLREKYAVTLADPEITVMVRSFGARVFIGGQVRRPGEFPLERPLTVLQAIWMAQGFTEEARLKDVVLIRRNPDGSPAILVLRMDQVLKRIDPTQDVALKPYDVVYVPKSKVHDVAEFINKVIIRNIPVSFGIRF